MADIDTHAPGTLCWLDLMTDDLPKAKAFYGELFGWSFDDRGPEYGGYNLAQLRGRNVAGLMATSPEHPAPTAWSGYLAVQDATATVARAQSLGARVMVPPMDVMKEGRMAVLVDPTGAAFGLWQPVQMPGLAVLGEPGAWVWSECDTRDGAKAADFYARLLGLEAEKIEPPGPEYWVINQGGQGRWGVSQMDANWPADAPPHWAHYFAVADVDASVKKVLALGGKVHVPAADTPWGRMSRVSDPQGASFTLMKPRPRSG